MESASSTQVSKKAKAEDTTSAPAAESTTPANPDMKPTKDFYATDYKNSRNFFLIKKKK